MNDNGPENPDALFWFGNERGATLVNYTYGCSHAIITQQDSIYTIQLYMGFWRRFVLWRTLNRAQRAGMSFLGGIYYRREYQRMGEAIQETDRLLQRCGAIWKRTFIAERYYFLML